MVERPEQPATEGLVLLTGVTGYVGGQLLRLLEEGGWQVRCMARRTAQLTSRVAPGMEVVAGDAVTGEGLEAALGGVETAFYLIHSMASAGDFEARDRRAAANFGTAARAAGVRRIVDLGGLADESCELSPHLHSRLEVGRVLRASAVPVIELRASIVIGSGSLSFEMIRALVEHLPAMVTPRWVDFREVWVPEEPARAFDAIRRICGDTGCYAYDTLWQMRGLLDLIVGGVGMRRGRHHPEHLAVGDTIDCWRVLRLQPGRAWLEFEVAPHDDGSRIRQTAVFEPLGLGGLIYWYGVYPLHALIFRGMLRGIAAEASKKRFPERAKSARAGTPSPRQREPRQETKW